MNSTSVLDSLLKLGDSRYLFYSFKFVFVCFSLLTRDIHLRKQNLMFKPVTHKDSTSDLLIGPCKPPCSGKRQIFRVDLVLTYTNTL